MAEEKSNESGAAGSAQNKLESSKTHARRAAEDLKSAATTMAPKEISVRESTNLEFMAFFGNGDKVVRG